MKKLLLVAALLIAALQTFAQIDPLRQKLDSMFQFINKTQIPTGYLKEYGAELMPIHCFNGVLTDSNAIYNINSFRSVYTDISTAKIQAQLPAMQNLTVVNSKIDSLKSSAAAPVALLYCNYASLRDDALSLNLFTISNQQVFDVAGRSQSPYKTNILFAAASINKEFTNTVSFKYSPSLFFTNTTVTVTQLSVDFKDGLGYKIIPANGTISKTYTDSSSTKLIDFRALLSTGVYLYCHSSVGVYVTTANTGSRFIGTDPYGRDLPVPVVAGEGLGGDIMQIRYSQTNSTRTSSSPHLRKPLIYVEGYDVSGKYNILNLIQNDQNNVGEWYDLLNRTGYDFMHNLDDIAGYDLVFVNYNTLRSFEDNTKMLQHVIEWVKQDKTAGGSTTQNVIIGTSAGGVLARYTLARMTKTISSASTDTRLLITHDSPHQGANVPLAFQHFLYDLGNVKVLGNKIKDNLEDLKNFYALNTLPATAQLLKARVIDENGTVVMNTFLNGTNNPYQQMVTFPATGNQPTYRFIATSQGSQCGIPVMPSDGLPLANYNGDFAIARFWFPNFLIPGLKFLPPVIFGSSKYFLQTQLTALPSSGTAQIEYFKYSRRFALWGIGFGTKTLTELSRNNPAGYTKWDAAPGSTQSINDRTGGALNEGLTKQKVPWYATLFLQVRAGLNMNITQDLFSFESTTSSLDAPTGTSLNMPYIFPNTGTSGTSSQKYIAQEKFSVGSTTYYNQNHTDFTARNSQWIYNEMENLNQGNLGCSSDCLGISYSISGNPTICGASSFSYSVNPVPTGLTVTWSVSPANIVTSPNPLNGSQTSISQINSGTVVLYATITNSCGGSSTISKLISVGTLPPGITILGIEPLQYGTQMDVQVNTTLPPPYLWYVNGSLVATANTTQTTINGGSNCNVTNTLKVSVSNSCGSNFATQTYQRPCTGSGFTIAPNPADNSAEIMVVETPSSESVRANNSKVSSPQRTITEIRILDNIGNLKKIQKVNSLKRATLNLANFQTGVYIVEISNGNYKERHQLIIKK